MDEKVAKVRNSQNLGSFWPPNFNGGRPQIFDPIYKMVPISDLLSYKGSLSVEPSRRSIGKRKRKRKKETSVEKQNASGHYSQYSGWAEV